MHAASGFESGSVRSGYGFDYPDPDPCKNLTDPEVWYFLRYLYPLFSYLQEFALPTKKTLPLPSYSKTP
jgi:hypothetical protein